MSTEVKRFSGRTYVRVTETAASRAFDDVFGPKPKATNLKWGNASFSKTRNDPDPPDSKKNKAEEPSDPFSFEFDEDRSPKKRKIFSTTVYKTAPAGSVLPAVKAVQGKPPVMKPAVRINTKFPKSDLEAGNEEFVVKKDTVKTYTRNASRKLKEEIDVSQMKVERFDRTELADSSGIDLKPSTSSSPSVLEHESHSATEDDELYIEKDDGTGNGETSHLDDVMEEEEDPIFKLRPDSQKSTKEEEESSVKFRSRYLDPEVYSKYTHSPYHQKDPIGRLSNSKVVHKSELKHDNGTTLIVVCSPKVADKDIKQNSIKTKYFKDSTKDLKKMMNKTKDVEEKRVSEDPYALEDDAPALKDKVNLRSSQQIQGLKVSQPASSKSNNKSEIPSDAQSPKDAPVTRRSARQSNTPAATVKYHKIFRSRNRGMVADDATPQDQQGSQDSSEPTTDVDTPSQKEVVTDSQTSELEESSAEAAEPEEKMEVSEADGQEESNDAEAPVLKRMDTDSPVVDSDVDSSQQSAGDSQAIDSPDNSQEVRLKKDKSAKPPPAERKIFRTRGSRGAAKVDNGGGSKKIFQSPKKSAAVYNVRSWQEEEEGPAGPGGDGGPPRLKPIVKKRSSKEDKDCPSVPPKLTRAVHWPDRAGDEAFTSVHVDKEHKELFTVVRNVKEAHECQEFGETQEFDDDIEYLLAGIKEIEPLSTRCLSCIGLAQKCIIPAFRMHLRAHGTVTKIFGCLQDAASDPSLALCTSALMFMLSRDRLNMDLDQDSLNLMLRLLGVDQQEDLATTLSPSATRALNRNRDRVKEVYEQFQKNAGVKAEIDLDTIATGNLAMESLLSLTSRRAGEWFKEELRSLGALDHIVDTVCSCVEAVGDDVRVLTNSCLENLKKVDRCLRVLENVTYLNADNQTYLISYKKVALVSALCRALRISQICLAVYPLSESVDTGKVDKESYGWVVYSCTVAVLRVLLNLTHDNEFGCTKVGEEEDLLEIILLCIFQEPQYVPVDLRFDLYVLSLGLLINLVEHCDLNRRKLIEMHTRPTYENENQEQSLPAMLSLVDVFKNREMAARQLEEVDEPSTPEPSPNKSGEWRESDSGMEWVIHSGKKDKMNSSAHKSRETTSRNGMDEPGKDLDDEETFTKALHKAGKHMENSIIAAYVSLLVGCLIQDNSKYADQMKSHLPNNNFESMIYMLKKFLGFMNLTSGMETTGGKSIARVIEILEAC